MALEIELQRYLSTITKYLNSADELIASSDPDLEQIQLHLLIFEKYLPKIEQFRGKKKEETSFATDAVPIIDSVFITQIKLEQLQFKLQPAPKNIVPVVPQPTIIQPHLSIPHLKLQSFDGTKRRTYPRFKESFKAIFDSAPLDNKQRFLRLQTYITGEAANYITHLPIEESSYKKAWDTLDHEFDDPTTLIAELYRDIHNTKPAKQETLQLRQTFNSIEAILKALEQYGESIENNLYLQNIIFQKFPTNIIFSLSTEQELTLPAFRKKMDQLIRVRERYSVMSTNITQSIPTSTSKFENPAVKPTYSTSTPSNFKPRSTLPVSSETKASASSFNPQQKQPHCAFCHADHYSDLCPSYTTLAARKAKITGNCFNCLNKHEAGKCRRTKKCYHCRQQHHSSLCPMKFGEKAKEDQNVNELKTPEPVTQTLLVKKQGQTGTYLTACTRIRNPETGSSKYVRIIFDGGCPKTLIEDEMADLLQLTRSNTIDIPVKGFLDKEPKKLRTSTVSIEIPGMRKIISIQTTPEIATNITSIDHNEFLKTYPQYSHIEFADEGNNLTPTILIGGDYYFTFIADKPKITVEDDLHLISSLFGWMIAGIQDNNVEQQSYLLTTSAAIEQLVSLDTIGIKDAYLTQADEEEQALKQFYEKIQIIDDRYHIGWPWKINPETLPSNYGISIGRLRSLYKTLKHKPELLQAYDNIFKQQIEAGILENAYHKYDDGSYIPHHGVYTPEKSTPIRIVFAGNAKQSKNNLSINEAIYKGRQLLEDQLGIILRFRKHKVAIMGDFEKAYLHIGLKQEDRKYVKCLWLKDASKPPEPENILCLQFTRIAFGIVASSFILQATIRYHLDKYAKEYPLLAHDFYADNLITGSHSEENAIKIASDSIRMFEICSMNLRRWSSSSQTVLQSILETKREKENPVTVLGLKWNTVTDEIYLAVPKFIETEPTFRIVLQNIARLYDPLGIFSPITLKAKIFLQSLRQHRLTYDEKLPQNLAITWKEILEDLRNTTKLQLPRSTPITKESEFHCFTDASKKGYGFVIYVLHPSTKSIHFIFAKAKVAPSRSLTIPKLELLAATLGARASSFVQKSLHLSIEHSATLWTDSKCTLARIYTSNILPTYEENRVREIRATKVTCRYVPAEFNVADPASRGQTFDEFEKSSWFTGPKFLSKSPNEWPKHEPSQYASYDSNTHDPETEVITALPVQADKQVDIWSKLLERYSDFRKLIKVTSYILRFVAEKISKTTPFFEMMRSDPYYAALRFWIKRIQKLHFSDIFNDLQNNKRNAIINGLRIQLDSEGILRSHGRFQFAKIDMQERSPILLPKASESKFVSLLILHYHYLNFHTGTNQTLTAIRRRYWLLLGRRSVYNVIKKCAQCAKFTARPYDQPKESDLPEFRLCPKTLPFTAVGMDTLGPITVDRSKAYILLVVCLVTRAVTLEPLQSLETKEMNFALRRVKARRTAPDLYYSDNAPQFKIMEQLTKENSSKQIIWKYIPVGASWMGGTYERLVSNVKQALERTFHHRALTSQQFRTILLEIEAIINSRPLTYIQSADTLTPLTPNDFLQAKFINDNYPTVSDTDDISRKTLLSFIRQSQAILDIFWRRWATTYLQELRERHRRDQSKGNEQISKIKPNVGDVVILKEALKKRNTWPLGIITELNESHDRKIRSAQVKVASGAVLQRPLKNLYPLNITKTNESEPNEDDYEIVEIEEEEIEE